MTSEEQKEREASPIQIEIKSVARGSNKNGHKATTLFFNGMTWKHDRLMEGMFESLGYRCKSLPTPEVDAFQLGKEFGNNG